MIRDRVESLSVFRGWPRSVVCVFRACFVGACVVGSHPWAPVFLFVFIVVLFVFCECFKIRVSQSESE